MTGKKDVPLKIELLTGSEGSPFLIRSQPEIRFILREIAQKRARAALYYGEGNDFFLTMLLDVGERHIWLDPGPNMQDNRRALHSDKVIFVSSHRQVKVQFVARRIESVPFSGREAFRLPLPDALLRLQRRDYYRLRAPARSALKCAMPAALPASARPGTPSVKREMPVLDISVGGVALLCAEHEAGLQPGKIYPDCRISLPGLDTLIATIRVKNVMAITARDGTASKQAGCEFLHLDGKMAMLLQRYIAAQQTTIPESP